MVKLVTLQNMRQMYNCSARYFVTSRMYDKLLEKRNYIIMKAFYTIPIIIKMSPKLNEVIKYFCKTSLCNMSFTIQ